MESCSHLLVLRAWREEIGKDQFEWRAHVRHVLSGKACYIRKWQDLVNLLNSLGVTEHKK